ncbi:MAG: cobalamin biosynthesis protein, partial [Cyanobacteria bacterium P01_H01_bin.130]
MTLADTLTSWLNNGPSRAGGLLLLAAFLDWIIGDPWHWYHPVQAIGVWIEGGTRWVLGGEPSQPLPDRRSPQLERWGGVLLGLSTIAGTGIVTALVVQTAHRIHPILGFGLEAIALASCFAGRSLRDAAWDVLNALENSGLEAGRSRLSNYVGRDTVT